MLDESSNFSKRFDIALFVMILLFATAGQVCFSYFQNFIWGMLLYFFSFICVLFTSRNSNKIHKKYKSKISIENDFSYNIYLQMISFMLFIYVVYKAYTQKDDSLTLLIWCACLILYVLSFIKFQEMTIKIIQRLKNIKTLDWIIVLSIVILASVLRVYGLDNIPQSINQEEGFATAGAMDIINGVMKGPFEIGPKTVWGWTYYSGLYYYGHALFIKLFGFNMFGNRMFAAVSGIIAVLFTMAFARVTFNKRISYLSGYVVAVLGIHIHFSRFGFPFIQNAMFGAIVVFLLILCEQKRHRYIFALTGISIGIAQYTWSAARVLIVVTACYLLFKVVQERKYLQNHFLHISTLIFGFILAFLPYIIPFENKIPNFIEGAKRDFIFGGFMSQYKDQALSLLDKSIMLFNYTIQALSEFNFYPDQGYCYAGPGPMLPFITSILFAIGLFYLIAAWKSPNSMILLLLFWGTVVGLVAMTGIPNYQRAVVILSLPPVIAALAIDEIFGFISQNIRIKRSFTNIIISILITILILENCNDYFNIFIKHSNAHANRHSRVVEYIKTIDPSYKVYIPNVNLHMEYLVNIYLGKIGEVHYGEIDKIIKETLSNKNQKFIIILYEAVIEKENLIEEAFPKCISKNLLGDNYVKIFTIEQ